MAPQGHGVGAGGGGGACANSSLEHQGCSPFYQDVTEDPYVDQVSSHPAHLSSASIPTLGHFKLLQNA